MTTKSITGLMRQFLPAVILVLLPLLLMPVTQAGAEMQELRKKAYSVLQKNRLDLLEISGVDIKRVEERQAQTAKEMANIAEKIGAHFRERATAVADVHRNTIKEYQLVAEARIKDMCFFCWPYAEIKKAARCDKDIVVEPLDDPAHARGRVDCSMVADNICRPYVELHGAGSGVPVSGNVKCSLVFSYPGEKLSSGRYAIRAHIQANGYHLLQLWGCGGCGGGAPATSGHLKLKTKLYVKQVDAECCPPVENVLLDRSTGGPPGAVEINRFISCTTRLEEGFDVIIRVEFEIDAGIDGCGQCFVDLETSKFFYFRVPVVSLCRVRGW